MIVGFIPKPSATKERLWFGGSRISELIILKYCRVIIADGRDPRKSILTLFGDFRDFALSARKF